MKKIISLSVTAAMLTLSVNANDDVVTKDAEVEGAKYSSNAELAAELKKVQKSLKKAEKKIKKLDKKLNIVKAHDAFDNIKFGMDFRNTVEKLDYKDNKTGVEASNNSLFTSRIFLTMASIPTKKLTFKGKLAIYSTWGAHLFDESTGMKDWSGSSKPSDTVMRVKEAYFIYKDKIGEQPYVFSVGRRASSNGFLANYRENETIAGSPLAHITNMETNAAMVKLDWGRFLEGAYTKFVYGRAHTTDTTGVYGLNSLPQNSNKTKAETKGLPYISNGKNDGDDKDVDFFVMPGQAYNDGRYRVMYQWAHIFDTKGSKFGDKDTVKNTKKAAAGSADLYSLGLLVDGVSEANEFLENTKVFASVAYTNYSAKDGYQLLGSSSGGSKDGNSVWLGAVFPDMITDSGKFGLEYNHGSQHWTPMTWAEDTAIGSKIAVRGDVYEAYWNFNLFGNKYLPSQFRYTHVQHDYTPNIKCAGWVSPKEVDITASNIRFAISYKY